MYLFVLNLFIYNLGICLQRCRLLQQSRSSNETTETLTETWQT